MKATIQNTYGAALVGCIFAAFLYGITCIQTCIYNMIFTKESRTMRAMVNILWVVDTIHLSCVLSTMYFFLISGRRRPPGSGTLWTDGALIIASNTSDFLVRCIFMQRIVHLSGNRRLCVTLLGTPSIVSAAFGIFYGVVTVSHPPSALAEQAVSFSVYSGLATSVVADVGISMTLCWLFWKMGHGVETAYPLMNKLRLFTIQAGVLPTMLALASLITYAVYPQTFMYMGIFFVLPKATLNSMLAMLNARKRLREVLPSKSLRLPMVRVSLSIDPNLTEGCGAVVAGGGMTCNPVSEGLLRVMDFGRMHV
ncbi:hypothetical protein BDY19DRAFT_959064 [Irpex rosettiformis]|uniref:Uncharacterized protein n=1 Tax=Irpex rosettiformis TaxID=378272 RepID=A0ACB8TXT1_9APHY|nr:hypothetical protein BDY19DRAFT_959064 [Irpex rosettiformis]